MNTKFMFSHPLHILSLGFGSGLSPIAPGTAGTLFAWASFSILNCYLTILEWGILITFSFLVGIKIVNFTAQKLGKNDALPIVWDEIVAFWLVMIIISPASFMNQLWSFIAFRFFDILKPLPIAYFDRRLKGGFGIMFDDLLATLYTLLVYWHCKIHAIP